MFLYNKLHDHRQTQADRVSSNTIKQLQHEIIKHFKIMTCVSTLILNPQLPNLFWMPLDSTSFDEYTDRSLLPQVSTCPFDYRPPPNSPYAGINCHGHDPQHQVEFPNRNRNLYLSQDYQT